MSLLFSYKEIKFDLILVFSLIIFFFCTADCGKIISKIFTWLKKEKQPLLSLQFDALVLDSILTAGPTNIKLNIKKDSARVEMSQKGHMSVESFDDLITKMNIPIIGINGLASLNIFLTAKNDRKKNFFAYKTLSVSFVETFQMYDNYGIPISPNVITDDFVDFTVCFPLNEDGEFGDNIYYLYLLECKKKKFFLKRYSGLFINSNSMLKVFESNLIEFLKSINSQLYIQRQNNTIFYLNEKNQMDSGRFVALYIYAFSKGIDPQSVSPKFITQGIKYLANCGY